MHGIAYVSRALIRFDDPALDELAAQAAVRNAELGVTGHLYFEDGRFLQYIEGDRQVVTDLMTKIAADARHHVLVTLHDDPLAVRRFPAWHMRRLRRGDLVAIRLERVLADYLELLRVAGADDPRWSASVWRMVDSIASAQSWFQSG